jgi:hypothetical protein
MNVDNSDKIRTLKKERDDITKTYQPNEPLNREDRASVIDLEKQLTDLGVRPEEL